MTVTAGVVPGPGVVRLLLRVLVCAGLVAGWLLAPPPPAWAHASFVTAQPAAGANLAAAPGVVTLRFSEPLVEELSRVVVTDPDGRQHSGGPTGEQTISVDVESTALGRYDVEWRTVSPVDGHTLRGASRSASAPR